MQSGLDLTAVRIAPRTPRNIAPVLDAGLAQVLKRLMHETFASAALKFLPGRWKDLSDEIAAAVAFYFTSLSLWRDGGSIGESLYGVVREDLVLKKDKLTAWNQVAFTALVHVCGPYVDNKLGKVRESVVLRSLDDEGSQEPLSETFLAGRWTDVATGAFWRKVFLSVYPAVKFGLGARRQPDRLRMKRKRTSSVVFSVVVATLRSVFGSNVKLAAGTAIKNFWPSASSTVRTNVQTVRHAFTRR